MNLQILTNIAQSKGIDVSKNAKTMDEFLANKQVYKDAIKEKTTHELGYKNPMDLINKIINKSKKNYDLKGYKFTQLSSSEKKKREKLNTRTKELFENKLQKKAIVNAMCSKFINNSNFREGHALISSFAKDEDEAKKVINFLNTKRDENNAVEYDRTKNELATWLDSHIKNIIKHVDYFSTYKNEEELLDYMQENYDDIFIMVELQGSNLISVAKEMKIPLNEETVNKFNKVSGLTVDIGFEAINRLSIMASDLYPKMHEDNWYVIPLLANKLMRDNIIEPHEANKFSSQGSDDTNYEQNYSAYLDKGISTMAAVKGRRFDGLVGDALAIIEDDLAFNRIDQEEYDRQYNLITNEDPFAFGLRNMQNSMKYLNERKLGNPKNVSYYLDGRKLEERDAFKAALDGKYVQMINKTTIDGVEKEELLLSFTAHDASNSRPDLIGRSLKVNIEKACENVRNQDEVKQTTQNEIKNTLNSLYASLKEGSRWYLSSKGDYGILMNKIKEANNCPVEEQAAKFNAIKEQAQKYLVSRAKEKTSRSDLSTLRESKVFQTLETIKNIENQKAKVDEINFEIENEVQNDNLEIENNQINNDININININLENNNEIRNDINIDIETGEEINNNNLNVIEEKDEDEPMFDKNDLSFNKEVMQENTLESKIEDNKEKKIEDIKIDDVN